MSFHFNLGQFISLALLGLSAYEQQDAPNSGGPSIFLNPQVITPYLNGVVTIFQSQQPAVAAASPVTTQAQMSTATNTSPLAPSIVTTDTHVITSDPTSGTVTITPIQPPAGGQS